MENYLNVPERTMSGHVLRQVAFRHDEAQLEILTEVRAGIIIGSIEDVYSFG
jgi:hypothetical protein